MSASSNEAGSGGNGLRLVLLGLIGAGLAAIWMLARDNPGNDKTAAAGNVAANQTGQAPPPWQGTAAGAGRESTNVDPDATPKIEAWLSERFDLPDPELIDGLLQFSRRRDIAMAEKAKRMG